MGHQVNGRNLVGLIGVYFVIKGILKPYLRVQLWKYSDACTFCGACISYASKEAYDELYHGGPACGFCAYPYKG